MNGGRPTVAPLTQAQLLARLTGAATLAAGALLYGVGTSQPSTLALGTPGQVLVAGASAPAWSDTFTTAKTINVASGTIQTWQIAAATKMVLDGSGNLGIGLTPTAGNGILQLNSGSAAAKVLRLTDSVNGTLEIYFPTTGNTRIQTPNAGALQLGTAATVALTIDTSQNATFAGNVGIGVIPTSGNGLLQLASGTTKANGIAFGTDTFFYRAGAGNIALDAGVNYSVLNLTSSVGGVIQRSGNNAIVIDTSQNASFVGIVQCGKATAISTTYDALLVGARMANDGYAEMRLAPYSNVSRGWKIGFYDVNTTAYRFYLQDVTAVAERLSMDANGSLTLGGTPSYGGGTLVMSINNRTAAPTSNPTGGGILYAEAGALKWRGSSGTVTTIAVA